MAIADRAANAAKANFALIILLCFFLSGMSGLIYQVVWVRELVLVFGATTFAVSTVLTAFMGGLALGSFYFGRRARRFSHPLRLYGWLEIGIGLYGLAVPFIFALLPPIYQPVWQQLHLSFFALSLVRFLFAGFVLILPTALMGATLPVLAAYYTSDPKRVGLRVGMLYSLNTFGAVLGASISGLVMIPALGMRATTFTAAAINLLLGAVAIFVSRADGFAAAPQAEPSANAASAATKAPKPAKPASSEKPLNRAASLTVLIGFALSGFIALSYEVTWSRVLALIIGSSVYAFSIMLTTFLIGLAVGASLAARIADRVRRPVMTFALIEIGVGVSSLIGAYLFNELPYVFVQLYRWLDPSDFSVLLILRFLVSSLVMIGPTLLLGALFPLVVRILASDGGWRSTSQTVGDAYAVNTLGSIIGSFASGFVLIPWLGLLGSLKLCVALNFVIAAALFIVSRSHSPAAPRQAKKAKAKAPLPVLRPGFASLLGVGLSLLLIVVVTLANPPWDSGVMSSAVYRYAPALAHMSREEIFKYLQQDQSETLFYKEGITATVSVQKQAGGRVLKVNGKPEASTAGDMPTQILIGSLPLLVRDKTDDVLLIGLGSGVTLGSIQQFPIRQATCVELEPAVIEASRYFNDVNNRPLEDPRLRMIANDGRNYIFTTDEKFDVIVSEPSNPWLTGVSNLFTAEYFQRGAALLKDDGLFSQWLQIYEMAIDDVRTLVATFKTAFPYVYLFRGAEGDLMLLGSKQPRTFDLDVIRANLRDPKVAADHRRINTTEPVDVISRLYLGTEEVKRFAGNAPINTDDNALIEFSAPRRVGASEETVGRNVNELLAHAGSPLPYIDLKTNDRLWQAEFLSDAAVAAIRRREAGRAEQFVADSLAVYETARAHSLAGELAFARTDEKTAMEEWRTALALDPNHFYTLINVGKYHLMKQDVEQAAPYLDRALALEPNNPRACHLRGLAYQAAGDLRRAAAAYRKALPDAAYTRSQPAFYLNFGSTLATLGLYEEAAQMLEQYVAAVPDDAEGHFQLGAVFEIIAERSLEDSTTMRAIESLKRALALKPDHAMAHYYLSKAYRRLGLFDEADAAFEQYERIAP